MRRVPAGLFGVCALLGAEVSLAQEFGAQGQGVIGAERLFGVAASRVTTEDLAGGDDETDTTTFSFAWQGQDGLTPYDAPRVAFDYFLIDGLSVGGSVAFAAVSIEGSPDIDYFLVNPRVGYVYMFNPTIGIWPRGGISYHSRATDNLSISGLGLSIECMFPVVATEHLAFHFGPTVDMDLTGEIDPELGPDRDLTYRSLGIRAGLMGWF